MFSSISLRQQAFLFFSLCFALLIYLVLRAIYVPLVHDEAATFFHFINSGIIAPYKAIPDAANHLLNSYLSRFFYLLFGNSELVIRLANLIFFPVLVIYTWKTGVKISNILLRWGFVLAVVFSHYFAEHFAYSRGYAMSIALMLIATYYLWRFLQSNANKHLFFCLAATGLMVFANLSTMNTGLMVLLFALVGVFYLPSTKWLRVVYFIPVIALFVYLAKFSLWMGSIGALYYGGDSFLKYTVQTIWPLWSGSGSWFSYGLLIAILLLALIATAVGVCAMQKKLNHFFTFQHIFMFLFVGNIAGAFMLHWLFNVNFPEDRVAMHFIPLLLGWLFFAVDALQKQVKKIAAYVLFGLSVLLPVNTILSANLTHATFWVYERIPHEFYDEVEDKKDEYGYPATISARMIKRLGWAYEIFSQNLNINQVAFKEFPGTVHDYLIIHEWQKHIANLSNYSLVQTEPINSLHLYKRKSSMERKPIVDAISVNRTNTDEEFVDFYKDTITEFIGKSLLAGLKLDAQLSNMRTTNFRVVLSVEDVAGNTLQYIPFICHWHREDWGVEQKILFSMVAENIPKEAFIMKCYLWNAHKKTFQKINCEFSLYELSSR